MLVLSRRENEVIEIGDDIRIVVVRIGHSVRLGIEAPADLKIRRGELPVIPDHRASMKESA